MARRASAPRRPRSGPGRRGTSGTARHATRPRPGGRHAHPLQATGDAGRRLDLHDEVDGTHVDAELEAARGHDRRQPAGLEVLLDELAVLLAHRPVMGPGQHGGSARAGARLRHDLGRGPRACVPRPAAATRSSSASADCWASSSRSCQISLRREVSRSASRRELAKTSVERCCATRSTIRSSTCGQMDARLSAPAAGPDRSSSTTSPRADMSAIGTTTSRSHSLVDGAGRPRPAPREVARHLVDRLDRRGQADALRRRLEQRVEPLERQGEMGAAFRAGHGVDLVEDDGLDAGERLARGRGEDEEQ